VKRFYIALLLAGATACGGGGSDPVTPPKNPNPPMEVSSGQFAVTAVMSVDGCSRTDIWDGQYDIQIDDKAFTMGVWVGTWDSIKGFAKGESVHDVHMVRECTVSEYTNVYLTFKDSDTFQGTIIFRHRVAGSCEKLKPCSTTWIVNGTRVATP
jgi:hypothetical protein